MNEINIEEYALRGEKPPKADKYKIKIDNENYTIDKSEITGSEILKIAKKEFWQCYELFKVIHGNKTDIKINNDDIVDLTTPGIEKFITEKIKVKTIFIDDEDYTTSADSLTPSQIMQIATISISDHYLKQIVGNEQISYKDKADIPIPICNNMKFVSIYLGPTGVSNTSSAFHAQNRFC